MVVALYFALWFTSIVSTSPTHLWKFYSILPALLICVFFFYIAKTASLLKAIYVVDTDAMLEVLEETDAAKLLCDELRSKVISRISESGEDPYQQLEFLYNEIDVNGSNSLSRSEFGEFMQLMDIAFSKKKWEQVYKEIDRNYDNEISLTEFYLFLYPDHDKAMSLEMKRLKVISKRVMSRANYFLSHLSPFKDAIIDRANSLRTPGLKSRLSNVKHATRLISASSKSISKIGIEPENSKEAEDNDPQQATTGFGPLEM